MKALISIFALGLTLGIASNAHAVLQSEGTFVPTQCGKTEALSNGFVESNVAQLCVGNVVGEKQKAVQVRFSDGASRIYHVAQTANYFIALESGNTKSLVQLVAIDGSQASMKVIRTQGDKLVSALGKVDGQEFVVSEFESVFTVQSAF